MPYFLRVHGGIGMHAGYLPGYPASHGCIRLPKEMALKFFEDAPVGTPVDSLVIPALLAARWNCVDGVIRSRSAKRVRAFSFGR